MDVLRGFKKKVCLVIRNNQLWADDYYGKNYMVSISFVEHTTYIASGESRKTEHASCIFEKFTEH